MQPKPVLALHFVVVVVVVVIVGVFVVKRAKRSVI